MVSASLASRSSGLLTGSYAKYPLVAKTSVSHNTILLRFGLPSPDASLGLDLGRHLSVRATIDGRETRRPYTPVSASDAAGYFELLVKVYPAPHGLMSRHLDGLATGDTMEVRGPLGKFIYNKGSYSRINMVCGGTGITPMWQVLRAILDDPTDDTHISLIFANVTEADILLREELEGLERAHQQFEVYYVLNEPPAGWKGGVGFVTKQILAERFGEPRDGALTLMCGPPPMNKAMKGHLATLGFKDEHVFKF